MASAWASGAISGRFAGRRNAARPRLSRWFGAFRAEWTRPGVPGRRRLGVAASLGAAPGSGAPLPDGPLYIGLDFGTSGARVILVDDAGVAAHSAATPYDHGQFLFPGDRCGAWAAALETLLLGIPAKLRARAAGVAVDATSGTALLVSESDPTLPLTPPLMYNEGCSAVHVSVVAAVAPADHTAVAPTGPLVKLAMWDSRGAASESSLLSHQADWLAAHLHGVSGVSDANNALKTGYDPCPEVNAWPKWVASLPYLAARLPQTVLAPGVAVGAVTPAAARKYGLPRSCVVRAGTTDSIAAFLAAGARSPGAAVTSLGSATALKLVSRVRVDSAAYGLYAHRLGGAWLVGGSSNVGGTALRRLFTDAQLCALSARIDPSVESPADYYPLPSPGERFPVCDPGLQPRLGPRPADDVAYLHGLLESIARVEARGYGLLAKLGASPATSVLTCGGGAGNAAYTAIRRRVMGVPVAAAPGGGEAAAGAAMLARGEVSLGDGGS